MCRFLAAAVASKFVIFAISSVALAVPAPRLVWIDTDQDGLDDLLHYVPGAQAHLFVNAGDGTFDVGDVGLDALPGQLQDAVRLDLEGPGSALALATAERTFVVEILDGATRVRAHLPGAESLEARDFDRDGRTDLVLDAAVYRQHADGTFRRVELPRGEAQVPMIADDLASDELSPTPEPTVGTEALADGAIRSEALADGAVTSEKLAVGSVQREHLAKDLVLGTNSGREANVVPTNPELAMGVDGDLVVSGVLRTQGTDPSTFAGPVFVGRSESVTSSEFFGVHAPVAVADYGGMYVSTEGENAWPFYGYAPGAGSTSRAWHFYEPETAQWRLRFSSDGGNPNLVVSADGNVGVGHSQPEARLHVRDNSDAKPGGGGGIVISNAQVDPTAELALDTNEIMARDGSGNPAPLYLNNNGGHVVVGDTLVVPHLQASGAVRAEGSDAEPGGGGIFIADSGAGETLAIDANEIMATNRGETSTLHLNYRGGTVQVGAKASVGILSVAGGGIVITDSSAEQVISAVGGHIFISDSGDGQLLTIDANEISASADGGGSPLHLNPGGATVEVGDRLNAPLVTADEVRSQSLFVQVASTFDLQVNEITARSNPGIDIKDSLHVHETVRAEGTDAEPGGGGIFIADSGNGKTVAIDSNEIMATADGEVSTLYLNYRGGTVQVGHADSPGILSVEGVIQTPELQITGGADLAERFEVRGAVSPGMVLSMDVDRPGALRPSHEAYDRKVVGIVSGANGLRAGVVLGDGISENQWPVALNGRAWVQCVAGPNGVAPGDFLTTSNRPGYAMVAADPARSPGAVVGKAMSALEPHDEGLVLVFVNPY